MFDCHIHSFFSGDSKMSMEDGCSKAIELGLSGIAFTDHIDYDYPLTDARIYQIDLEKYDEEIERVRKIFGDKLIISKGIEMGLQKQILSKISNTLKDNRFDIVIGSMHVIDKTEIHNGDFTRNKTQNEAYRIFLEKTLEILRKFDDFDILGHIDIIRRYGNYAEKNLKYCEIADVIDEILKVLIIKGKGIEINTSGVRYGLEGPLPSFEIVKRYFELGGEILTIGSDGHCTRDIGFEFDVAIEMAKKAGFKYISNFENRKPVYHKI